MWEAVALPGCLADAEELCRDVIVPAAREQSGCRGAEWFTDGESRVVVITRWETRADADGFAEDMPDLPVLARHHAWTFAVGG
jgi:quinol monooxygenase YgiN